MKELHFAVIGDSGVGKRWLIVRFCSGKTPYSLDEKSTASYASKELKLGESLYLVHLRAYHGDFMTFPFGKNIYQDLDCVLLCFPVYTNSHRIINPDEERKLRDCWIPEVKRFRQDLPIVLVGTKADLRPFLVNTLSSSHIAKMMGVSKYVECSAFTGLNVEETIKKAIQVCRNIDS